MNTKRAAYVQARTTLLEQITENLQKDERFVAAWLAGSFGRGEETWLSDLDLYVVVAANYSDVLCARPWPRGARTTPERLALFAQFGTPGIVFDVHSNNQADQLGGSFTNVVYQESGQSVDWMLVPQVNARLERPSLLLFDKIGLPERSAPEPETPEQCRERAATTVGYFWILACGCARALAGDRLLLFYTMLLWLEDHIREVKAAIQGKRAKFTKLTNLRVYGTPQQCADALRRLCDEMELLMPQVVQLGGYVPFAPRAIIETRLALLEE